MKNRSVFWMIALLLVLCIALAACDLFTSKNNIEQSDPGSELVSGDVTTPGPDKPTIPDDVANIPESWYDFKFSERYDGRVSDSFSLTFPAGTLTGAESDTLRLLERYQLKAAPAQENVYDSDGMLPHKCKDYNFSGESGKLFIKTDFYEPDNVEYINYVYTDIDGVKTDLGVGIGNSEKELLTAYTGNLYYLGTEQTEPIYFSLELHPVYEFDYVYAWQPFTPETNEIRDITFHIKDGTIVAVEMVKPFELRYVYGCDRDAALQRANENRNK